MLKKKLGAMDGLSLDKHDGVDLGWLEGSTNGTIDGNLGGSRIGFWIVSVVGLSLEK